MPILRLAIIYSETLFGKSMTDVNNAAMGAWRLYDGQERLGATCHEQEKAVRHGAGEKEFYLWEPGGRGSGVCGEWH